MTKSLVEIFRGPSNNEGTLGLLSIPKKNFICTVLELPWEDNAVSRSCIPKGTYEVVWNYSNTFKRNMYLILDVPGRSGIRIHAGNWAGSKAQPELRSDSFGCPLLGYGIGTDSKAQKMITQSRNAVDGFETLLDGEDFILQITGSVG